MKEVEKKIERILNRLDELQETLETAINQVAVFYTTLKQKDADEAYNTLIFVKDDSAEICVSFDKAIEQYEAIVDQMIEEEEDS